MKEFLQNLISKLFPSCYLILKFNGIENYDRVIDLGCGKDSIVKLFNNKYKLGVDIFDDYLNYCKKREYHSEYLKLDLLDPKIQNVLDSFDAAICFDVIEHFEKKDAEKFIELIENSPVKFIAFRTTSEFVNQEGYDSNSYQIHKSFTPVNYFKSKGYRIYGEGGPLFLTVKNGNIVNNSVLSGTISYLLRPIFFFFPEKSLNYVAIKIRG
jgi:hypothetical protein